MRHGLGRSRRTGLVVARSLLASTLLLSITVVTANAASGSPHASVPRDSSALDTVSAAVRKTLSAGSAQVRLRLSDAEAFGKPGRVLSADGSFNFAFAQGVLRSDPQLIFAYSQIYIRQPASPSVNAADKPWTLIDFDSEELLEVKFQSAIAQAESINPLLVLQLATWGGVRAEPSSSKAGAQTFEVMVALAGAAAAVAGPVRRPFVDALSAQRTHRRRIPVMVTIDREGWVSRVGYTPPGAAVGTVTLSLSGFGTPVDVQAPAKDQVTDLLAILKGAEGESNEAGESHGG
jgi:hypothetical protein